MEDDLKKNKKWKTTSERKEKMEDDLKNTQKMKKKKNEDYLKTKTEKK